MAQTATAPTTTATAPNTVQTVLVTGGAGFLGINLFRYLHERGYDLVSLDIADFDYPDMRDKVFVVRGDIRDRRRRRARRCRASTGRPHRRGAAALLAEKTSTPPTSRARAWCWTWPRSSKVPARGA